MTITLRESEMSGLVPASADSPRGSSRALRYLLVLTIVTAVLSTTALVKAYLGSSGLLAAPGKPFGDDFINLWTTAQLVLSGSFDAIYRVADFAAFEQSLAGEYIGYRLWAYPPHSLLFAGSFGLLGYHAAFVAWTLLGLGVLAAGARRIGFDWLETGILTLSPASMQCIANGQTGNLVCGLLLFALAHDAKRPATSAVAAAVLTIKPQAGFLLPVVWAIQRCWKLILVTSAAAAVLLALSVAVFGLQPWKDYFGDTLPGLSRLERHGTGPFLYMIPSMFISMRLLGADANVASAVHFAFAGVVFAVLLWRLVKTSEARNRAALVLIGTCLITPYLHVYDLGILLAGALLVLQTVSGQHDTRWKRALIAVAVAWLLPKLVLPLGAIGLPVSPAIILFIFAVACLLPAWQRRHAAQAPA